MRINIYRTQNKATNSAVKPPERCRQTAGKAPANCRKSADKMPAAEQEQQIYQYVLKNTSVTTAQAMELLGVKQRRTREILLKMVKENWLKKKVHREARFTHWVKGAIRFRYFCIAIISFPYF